MRKAALSGNIYNTQNSSICVCEFCSQLQISLRSFLYSCSQRRLEAAQPQATPPDRESFSSSSIAACVHSFEGDLHRFRGFLLELVTYVMRLWDDAGLAWVTSMSYDLVRIKSQTHRLSVCNLVYCMYGTDVKSSLPISLLPSIVLAKSSLVLPRRSRLGRRSRARRSVFSFTQDPAGLLPAKGPSQSATALLYGADPYKSMAGPAVRWILMIMSYSRDYRLKPT